jgi:hypothetical protein
MWLWAMHNVREDLREREKLLFSFMDTLTWWLQPKIKADIRKMEQNRMPDADLERYAAGLREAGATEEYVANEIAAIEEERQREKEVEQMTKGEDGDNLKVVKGPGLS